MTRLYEDLTISDLGTKRQRPMFVSELDRFKRTLSMKDYPSDPHAYTEFFISSMDRWVRNHRLVSYLNLDSFSRIDSILGTTHQLDELHMLHGSDIAVFKGEYKYHRRLTDFRVKQIVHYSELSKGDVLVISYPSCITTGYHAEFEQLLDHCLGMRIPVHIDGAWFGQCRNFEQDVSHPAIHSVSISLSKALGMGSQRIGIRYTRDRVNGPISIMNDFNYANVSDMWIGVEMMNRFGTDYWWRNYSNLYSKVCKDFDLEESNSIHVAWKTENDERIQLGIRTPLRMLIDGIYDMRGTDKGLNTIESEERIS